MKEFWTLRDLASEFEMDPSSVRKFAVKNGIDSHFRRTAATGNQKCMCFDHDGYVRFKELRDDYATARVSGRIETKDKGLFYFIQLVPEAIPGRVKLGYTSDLTQRLQAHRCVAPTLVLLDTWSAKPGWESMAISAITNLPGTVQVGAEVFDFQDIDKALDRANVFFSFLSPVSEEEEDLDEASHPLPKEWQK